LHQNYNYTLRIEFEESQYDNVLLFIDSQGITCFEEGESSVDSSGNIKLINEYSLVTFRFSNEEELSLFEKKLSNDFPDIKAKNLGRQENFLDEWKKYAKAISITQSMTVLPTWLAKQEDYKDKSKIILDAAYAFGSGSHETTVLCAKEVEKLSPVESVLDVGCGSGILSMIAARSGCKKIKAIDIDPQAVRTAKENAEVNLISNIEFSYDQITEINEQYDLVVANILSHILLELKEDLIKAVKLGGKLVLSGILVEDLDKIVQEFNLDFVNKNELNEWGVLTLLK